MKRPLPHQAATATKGRWLVALCRLGAVARSFIASILLASLLISPLAAANSTWNKTILDPTPYDGAELAQAADFDGDGDLDILVSVLDFDAAGEDFAWWANDGAGNFTKQPNICGLPWCPVNKAITGDFDGDSDMDLLTYNSWNGWVSWWKNDGSGNFTEIQIEQRASGETLTDIHATDIDNDGDLDIQVAKWTINFATFTFIGEVAWWRNDGGIFNTKIIIDNNTFLAGFLANGDMDGDGDQDLIASAVSGVDVGLVWWRYDGGSSFTKFIIDGVDSDSVSSLRSSDLDGDGDDDVIAARFTAGVDASWWRNDGGGIFSKFALAGTGGGGSGLYVVDLDGDLDQDVLIGNDSGIVWARNDGGGTFTSVTIDASFSIADPESETSAVHAADFDGDGDLDIVATAKAVTSGGSSQNLQPDGFAWWEQVVVSGVVVDVTASDANATETGGDPGEFTISRTGATTSPLTVYYTMSGTATSGSDYNALSGNIIIPAGQASITLTVTPIDDILYEDPESAILTISADPAYTAGINNAVVTIADDGDSKPLVNFDVISQSVMEGNTVVNIAVSLSKPAGVLTSRVHYDITGTATFSDYNSITPSNPVPPDPGNPDSLEFNPGETTQYIIVDLRDDTTLEPDDTLIFTLVDYGASSNHVAGPDNVHTLTILDNESQRVTISATDANAAEPGADTGAFEVNRYNGSTTASLTVNYTVSGSATSGVDYTALSGSVVIPAGQRLASFTVTPLDDALIEGDETITVTLSADAAYKVDPPSSATVTLVDDDSAGITINPTSGLVTTEAGGTATFTVVLDAEPSDPVTIALFSSDATEGTVSPSFVTFTAADWNIPQTVTVTGVDDFSDDGDIAYTIITAPASSLDTNFNGVDAADVSVSNTDDEIAGITVSPTAGLTTDETGDSDSFTIVLDSLPSADVTIGLSSSDTSEGSVSPPSVTFTSANWNVPQIVTVTGVDDAVQDGNIAFSIVTAAATSADGQYNTLDASDVSVNNVDNETAGIKVAPTAGLTTTEAGGTDTFTVVLYTAPTADVTIGVSSSNLGEGTASPPSLTFTPANWNTPQTVTVAGVDDVAQDGDITYSIITSAATSADVDYNGLDASDVAVINADDDTPGISVNPKTGLITSEAGGADTFTVVLDIAPSADVIIALSSSDPTEGTVLPASLTFTTANWNMPQTVTVTGVDDDVDDGDIAYTIVTAPASSADTSFNGLNAADVSVTNSNNDVAGITVNPTSGLITTEAGGTDTFTMVLDSQPSADVTIGLSSDDTAEGTVSVASLTFTPANWNIAQTVTVSGVDDAVQDGDAAYAIVTIAAASSDFQYNGRDASDVTVTNLDDDVSGITVNPASSLITTEAGGMATFTVALATQPTADVTIALSSSDTTEGSVAPASLTFTIANWSTAQTVSVTGVDDDIDDGDIAYTIVTAAATSADVNYNGLDASDVSATNTDDDTAGITVNPPAGFPPTQPDVTTTEGGGTDIFYIVLDSQPTGDVTIGLSSTDTTEGTVTPASLTFTTANWNAQQAVTVAGVDDSIDDGDIVYTIVTAPAVSADINYNSFDANDQSVTNIDNDSAGIVATPATGLITDEGGASASFSVSLSAQPTADVSIPIASSNTAEGTVSAALLTFTPANWNIPQTVVVSGIDDAIVDGNVAYTVVLGAATSSDPSFNGLDAGDVSVINQDNDIASIAVNPVAGLVTSEGGASANFTIVMGTQPSANVTVPLSSSDISEGTVAPASVTFTPADWNIAQTVTVTGVDDVMVDGDIPYAIRLLPATSGDSFYDGFDPSDVMVTNTDDDIVGITVSPSTGLTSSEDGGSDSFTIVLDSPPLTNVNIALSSSDSGEGAVSPGAVIFTPSNWNIPKTVTVTGVDDASIDGNTPYTIVTAAATSTDTRYLGLDPDDVTVTNIDNDIPGFTVTPAFGLSTSEAGGTASFTIVLNTEITSDVSIGLLSSDASEGTVTPSALTFTPATWNVPQTVIASGVDDAAVDGNVIYTILTTAATSADVNYNGIDPSDISLSNTDDDTPGPIDPTANLGLFWEQQYDSGNFEEAADVKVEVDVQGNVYVTGRGSNGVNSDFVTVKFDGNGNQLWVAVYDGGDSDLPLGLRLDSAGNSYVAGRRHNGVDFDYVVVKYDSNGNEMWVSTPFDTGAEDEVVDMALDGAGNVYLTGNACAGVGVCDIATVRFSSTDGSLSWSAIYDNAANANDIAAGIGLDVSGNVYVAGRSRDGSDYDITTIKYDNAGVQQWVAAYDNDGSNDYPAAIAVDAAGNSYIAGRTFLGFGSVSDYQLVKYNSSGIRKWVFTQDIGSQDRTVAVAVDSGGSVYLSGSSGTVGSYDFSAMKINPDGTLAWIAGYDNGGSNDEAVAMAVDGSGRVYVTGSTGSALSADRDFVTVAYDPAGILRRTLFHDVTAFDDVASGIALGQDADGLTTVHVAGTSIASANNDIVIAKYGALLPDLTMSAIAGPATGVIDGPVSINTTAANEISPTTGSNKDAGAFDVGLYLSTLSNLTQTGLAPAGEVFFDDFSDGTLAPWSQYGAGSVKVVDKGGTVGWVLDKNTGADPDGGLALFSAATSDFELTLYTRRTAKSASALWSRFAVTDGAGNGYGIRIEYDLNTNNANLRLEKRIAYIGNGNEPAAAVAIPGSVPLNSWYTLHLKKVGATLSGEIYSGKVSPSLSTPLASTTASDSSYNSFSQVVIQGGFAYDVDDIRVVSLDLTASIYAVNDPAALIALGSYNVASGLAAGDTNVATTTPAIPTTVAPGSYYLVAVADDGNAVTENIESNNTIVASSAIAINDAADLQAASVVVNGPGTELAGSNILLDYTIDNLRAPAAGAFSNSFVLSSDTIVGNGDDIAMPLVSGGTETGVAGNSSVSGSATVSIPAAAPPGSYYIGMLADSGGSVTESDEGNNVVVSAATFTVNQIVDLSITAVSAPFGSVAGGSLTVANTVQATDMAAGPFDVGIYLSTDAVIDATDTLLSTRAVAGLSAGQQNSDNTAVTIPSGTADGIYYIGAIADINSAVTEWNESNNARAAGNSISLSTTLPELVVSKVQGPLNATRGSTISVSTTVENALPAAAGSHRVAIYLSTDSVITTSDTYIGDRPLASLAGNSSDTASTNVTIPVQLGTSYRRPITITNNGSALNDQQITITMDTATLISTGKMRSDGGDIRFYDSDDSTLLNYWVESGLNTSSTKIWVKVPQIPVSSKTIYMHYGNSTLTSLSNADNTMVFYDDFESYSEGFDLGSSSKWVNNNPSDVALQAMTYNGSRRLFFNTITPLVTTSVNSITFGDGVMPLVIEYDHTTDSSVSDFENEYIRTGGSGSLMPLNSFWQSNYSGSWVGLRSVAGNTTYAMKNILTGSRAMNYIDGVLEEDIAYSGVASSIRYSSYQGRAESFYMDNIKVYRYAAVAPIVSLGAEEGVSPPVVYYLGAIVDDLNVVVEVNENNNAAVQTQGSNPQGMTVSVLSSGNGRADSSASSSSGGGGGAFDLVALSIGLFGILLVVVRDRCGKGMSVRRPAPCQL